MEVVATIGFNPSDFVRINGPEDCEVLGGDADSFSSDSVIKRFVTEIDLNLVMSLKIPHGGCWFKRAEEP
ncbi:MAG: hypothetical protein WCW64_05145 [Phycisphaerae bacterium]